MIANRAGWGLGCLAATSLGVGIASLAGVPAAFLLGLLAFPVGVGLLWWDARANPGQSLLLARLGGWTTVAYLGLFLVLFVLGTPLAIKKTGTVNPNPPSFASDLAERLAQLLPFVIAAVSAAFGTRLLPRRLGVALLLSVGVLFLAFIADTLWGATGSNVHVTFLPRALLAFLFLVSGGVLAWGVPTLRHPRELTGVAPKGSDG